MLCNMIGCWLPTPPACLRKTKKQYDSSEGGEIEGRRQQQPASAALRALRADIKTYTEVGVLGNLRAFRIGICRTCPTHATIFVTQKIPCAAAVFILPLTTSTQDVEESQSERLPAFLNSFDLGARTKGIATLLKEDPVVAKIHTQLVS